MDAAVEDREHRLVKPGRRHGLGGHLIVNTVSLNRDEGMSAEDATWENQHRLYTGRSAPTANGME